MDFTVFESRPPFSMKENPADHRNGVRPVSPGAIAASAGLCPGSSNALEHHHHCL